MLSLSELSMNQNQITDVALDKRSSPPSNPVEGQYYYNTNDGKVYYYKKTEQDTYEWTEMGNEGGVDTEDTEIDCILPNDL